MKPDCAIEPGLWNAHQAVRLIDQRGTHVYFTRVHDGVMEVMSATELADRYEDSVVLDLIFVCYRDGEAYHPVADALRYCKEKLDVHAPLLALAYVETPDAHVAKHLTALAKVLEAEGVLGYVGDTPDIPGFPTTDRGLLEALARGDEDDDEAGEHDGSDQEGRARDDDRGGAGRRRVQAQRAPRVAREEGLSGAGEERGWRGGLVDHLARLPAPVRQAAQSGLLRLWPVLSPLIDAALDSVELLQDIYDALEELE